MPAHAAVDAKDQLIKDDWSGPVLEVDGLRTEFHLRHATARAVDSVSFSVRRGECLGLVGESGCGKTTIGLSILKLLPQVGHITGGSVRLNGRDLVSLDERQMRRVRGNEIAMIFQDPMTSLNPTWTIGRQIAEPVRIHRGVSKKDARKRAVEVLNLVGMPRPEERLNQYPHQLSGGLRQRVMIAMALACEPKLLIADEPTTALDVTIQAQILDLIDSLRQRLDMAVLLITHDMGVIASRTDRVMVMYAGKIVEGAGTSELFGTIRHPYSEALFESIPRLDQDRSQRLYTIPGVPPDLSADLVACRFAPRCRYATEVCSDQEPLLRQGDGPSRSSDAPLTSIPAVLEAPPSEGAGEHVFACFHPVASSRSERQAFHEARVKTGVGDRLAQEPLTGRDVLLEVRHIEKEYTVTAGAVIQRSIGTVKAVSDVSFSIRRGETFGLVGESGCGKTTIGRLVVALEPPTGGTIRFEGDEISAMRGKRLRSRRRDVQLMFQDPYSSLDPRMRVGAIVAEPLRIQGLGSRRDQEERVAEVLAEVGLSSKAADLYPHEFSGGQRQRIGLARALVLQPKLIVADEPVSALDVSIQAQILNLIRSLQERHDLTLIVISHDLAVLEYLADTIGVMYLGKLVELGPALDVYANAAHPYTRGLIDTIPVPDPAMAKRHEAAVKGELPSSLAPPSGCRFRTRCPFAQAICAEEEPPLRLFGNGHLAACHFPLQTPVSDEANEVSAA
jgi:peptide/nickel transport system ATP-binding protein